MELEIIEFLKEARVLNRQLHLIKTYKNEFSKEEKQAIIKIVKILEQSIKDVKKEVK